MNIPFISNCSPALDLQPAIQYSPTTTICDNAVNLNINKSIIHIITIFLLYIATFLGNKIILLGNKIILLGKKIILLGKKIISLGKKIILLGKNVILLENKIILLGKKIISLGNKFILLGIKIILLGNKIQLFPNIPDFIRQIFILHPKNISLSQNYPVLIRHKFLRIVRNFSLFNETWCICGLVARYFSHQETKTQSFHQGIGFKQYCFSLLKFCRTPLLSYEYQINFY